MTDGTVARGLRTVARTMVDIVPVAGPDASVDQVRESLRSGAFEAIDTVCVVDPWGRLVGLVGLDRLLRAAGSTTIGDVMLSDPPAVLPDERQDVAAAMAVRHHMTAVPVVDESRRLVGVIGPLSLLQILRREHVEDLHRLAGMRHRSEQVRQTFRDPPLRRLEHRLPWLLVGLAGSGVAAFIVSRFAGVLEAWVAVAFFLPGIVYLADAIGTQTEAITVRGLSLESERLPPLLKGEIATGLLIGIVLALVTFPLIWIVLGNPRIAAAVALAILGAGTVATGVGIFLPWTLARFGKDPAFGSGPLATVIQDVLSLLIYFALVRILLG